MVPTFNFLNVGTVPMWCILNVGTVPTWSILNVGTVPMFNFSLKNKQIVNVLTFDSVIMRDVLIYDSGIESNFHTFAICLFFIAQ